MGHGLYYRRSPVPRRRHGLAGKSRRPSRWQRSLQRLRVHRRALRQVCWSHLMRDFQAMIDRGGAGQGIGERLLTLSKRLFRQWHRVRDATLTWVAFQERMRRLRREVKEALEDGSACGCVKTAATCFEILKVEEG